MKNIVIGTAGHIDHGKSALVMALTGTDPDRLKEEKLRGITIDLGFAHFERDGVNYAFVDVPGHERFVKNMLAGATGVDAVMLVVAADESVMPQTREHFDICRLLQVPRGVVAITKADLADDDTIELVRMEVRELVAGSFLERAPFIAVSARTGAGLEELRQALRDIAHASVSRSSEGPPRLPIDRVFTVKGFGTVVTGTLVSGSLDVDTDLVALPLGRKVKVRGLQVHGRREPRAGAGQRVAVNLAGIDTAELSRGETLAAPGVLQPTRQLDAVIDLVTNTRALRHGARVRFHQGTSELLGRVAIAAGIGSDLPQPLPEVPPGRSAHVRIRLEAPAVLTRGDRFILRAYSPPVTVGGGEVLDPQPPRGSSRSAAARQRVRQLDEARVLAEVGAAQTLEDSDLAAVRAMLAERGVLGLTIAELTTRAGIPPAVAAKLAGRAVGVGHAVRAGDRLIDAATFARIKQRLVDNLKRYHAEQPLSEGMPREEARDRTAGRAATEVFERVLEDLVTERKIMARDRLALSSHRLSLTPEEERARDRMGSAFRDGGLRPPDAATLGQLIGASADVADRMLKLLLRQRVLVKVDTLYFHADALEQLKNEIAAMKALGAREVRVDVATFKERFGVSRKFAIPLLEYLDRERVTRRVGEGRIVL